MRKLIYELGGRKFFGAMVALTSGIGVAAVEQFTEVALMTGSVKLGLASVIAFIVMEGAKDLKQHVSENGPDIAKQVIDELEKRAEGK